MSLAAKKRHAKARVLFDRANAPQWIRDDMDLLDLICTAAEARVENPTCANFRAMFEEKSDDYDFDRHSLALSVQALNAFRPNLSSIYSVNVNRKKQNEDFWSDEKVEDKHRYLRASILPE